MNELIIVSGKKMEMKTDSLSPLLEHLLISTNGLEVGLLACTSIILMTKPGMSSKERLRFDFATNMRKFDSEILE